GSTSGGAIAPTHYFTRRQQNPWRCQWNAASRLFKRPFGIAVGSKLQASQASGSRRIVPISHSKFSNGEGSSRLAQQNQQLDLVGGCNAVKSRDLEIYRNRRDFSQPVCRCRSGEACVLTKRVRSVT